MGNVQARARQAAIGAAVERLPKGASLNRDHADGWWQVVTFPPNGRAKWCEDILAAIAAALEAPTERIVVGLVGDQMEDAT